MKKIYVVWLVTLFVISLLISAVPTTANNTDDNNNGEGLTIPPQIDSLPVKNDPLLINIFDPKSQYYDPSKKYYPPGSRFAQPGKGTEGLILTEGDHECWGTEIPHSKNPNIYGIQACQAVYNNINLNEDEDLLYAPTMIAGHGCPLEMTTFYHRIGATTYRLLQIYDFIFGDWTAGIPIDAYFMSSYVRSGNYLGRLRYNSDTGLWGAYLVNYNTASWTPIGFYELPQTNLTTDGWSIWEEWSLDNNWPSLPQIWSKWIQVKLGTTGDVWTMVTPTYGNPGPWYYVAPYPHYFVSNYSTWRVGPGPQ